MGFRKWLASKFRRKKKKPDLGEDYSTIVELRSALEEIEEERNRLEVVNEGLEERIDLMGRAAVVNEERLTAARKAVKRKEGELQILRDGARRNTDRLAGQIMDEAANAVMGVHLLVGSSGKIKGISRDLLSYLGYKPESSCALVNEDLDVLFVAKGGMKHIRSYLGLDNGAREKVRWGFYGREKVVTVRPVRIEPISLDIDNVDGLVPDNRWENPLGYRIGFDIRSILQRMKDALRGVESVGSGSYEGEVGLTPREC